MGVFRGVISKVSRKFAPAVLASTLIASGAVLPSPNAGAKVDGRTLSIAKGTSVEPGYKRRFQPSIPTQMIGFDWNDKTEGALQVRYRSEGGWSDWHEIEGNPDEGPDPGTHESTSRTHTPPVWLGGGVEDIEIEVVEGRLTDLRVHLIQSESSSSPAISTASATPAQPEIISRLQWGADESWRYAPGCDGNPDYASRVKNAFVHHTVNSNNYSWDEADDVVRGIYRYHTHSNGWCDIGYNFLIDRFGRVYEGRFGGITSAVVGAHAGGFNTESTGVALIGTHDSAVPSSAVAALKVFLAWKLAYHGVDAHSVIQATSRGSTKYAAGTVVSLWSISGHRDVSATACPGNALYYGLPTLRQEIQQIVMDTPPYPLPGWTPEGSGPSLATIDAYGGVHPAGSHGQVVHHEYWARWAVIKDAIHEGSGGYLLDAFGALHKFGNVPDRSSGASWPGWEIARALSKGPLAGSGYVLDGFGGIHAFGGAPLVPISAYWNGWDIARDLAMNGTLGGGYVLDGFGGIHPVGAAPPMPAGAYWGGWDIARAIALRPDGKSGYVLDGWGGLHPFGGAPQVTSPHYAPGMDIFRNLVLTADGGGGWTMTADGEIWGFGNAPGVKMSLTWTKMGIGRAILLKP